MNKLKNVAMVFFGELIICGCCPKNYEYVYQAKPVDIEVTRINDEESTVKGSSAFQLENHFVWGGSTVKEKDGRYYMIFMAIETGVCSFNEAWVLGAKLGVAVSDRPDGDFKHLQFFYNVDGFAADSTTWDAQTVVNPSVCQFNDKYYLYYIGSKDRGNQGVVAVGDTLPRRDRIQQYLQIGAIEFDSFEQLLAGHFKCSDGPVLSARTRVKDTEIINPSPMGTIVMPDNIIVSNPSVVYRPTDGKYLMYFKGNRYDPHWRGVHGVAIADAPMGPFVTKDFTVFEIASETKRCSAEDPYVWYSQQDKKFFAVLKDFNGLYTKGEKGLAVMESKDGINWVLPQHSSFMQRKIELLSGEIIEVDRLERPQLYINEEGVPEVLYAACAVDPVNSKINGGSFNIQIPLIRKKVVIKE